MDESDLAAKPRLRPIEVFPVQMEGREVFCLRDPESFAAQPIFLNRALMFIVSRMDGTNSLRDIQADIFRTTGDIMPMEDLEALVKQLDENRYLDSAMFRSYCEAQLRQFLEAPTRPARHAGSAYEGQDSALLSQLDGFFAHPDGPGKNISPDATRPLRGLISPHVDFLRGGPTYAHAYHALAEHPGADRFIVFGTCHNPMRQRFAFTLKDFETPLGIVETDREFVGHLVSKVNTDYFIDEFSHRGEHSIEFQAVWLKYVLRDRHDLRIVPILVGSFQDICLKRESPADIPDIREMVNAVRKTMDEVPGRCCVIAGADLAHVGRRFGDPFGPTERSLREVEEEDRLFLERAVACDAEGVFDSIAADDDRRRVCGYPPIYMTLRCLEKSDGSLLQYRQWADLAAGACVTYAAVALY
jgi:AmmeMemoRadiSam system protein B